MTTAKPVYFLPLWCSVCGEGNQRENWRAAHRRHKGQRQQARLALNTATLPSGLPAAVTFVRYYDGKKTRPLDEGDNLSSAFKAVRDEVAKFFGVNDGPKDKLVWGYEQGRFDGDPQHAPCGIVLHY